MAWILRPDRSYVLQAFIDICTGSLEMIREALRNHRVLWVLGI